VHDGFDEFYRDTSRRTLRYAYALCGDAATAQDLTQEAYVRAWQRWRRVETYEHPDAWVRLVVARLATDGWRRMGLRRRFDAMAEPVRPVAPPSEDTVLITAALRRLPAKQRQAVALYHLLDLPVHEIAAEMDVSEGTVKSWLARGRAALAQMLGTNDEEASHVG
jgi:RNA polymerase sigma-70 factor (ECF subfamily)